MTRDLTAVTWLGRPNYTSAQGPSEQRDDASASSSGASGWYGAVSPHFSQAGADPDTKFHVGPGLEVPAGMWEAAGKARFWLVATQHSPWWFSGFKGQRVKRSFSHSAQLAKTDPDGAVWLQPKAHLL